MKFFLFILSVILAFSAAPTRFSRHRNVPGTSKAANPETSVVRTTQENSALGTSKRAEAAFFQTNPFFHPDKILEETSCEPFTWDKWLSALKISQIIAAENRTLFFLASERKKKGVYKLDLKASQTLSPQPSLIINSPNDIELIALSTTRKSLAFLSSKENGETPLSVYFLNNGKTLTLEETGVTESIQFLPNSEVLFYLKKNFENNLELWKASLPQGKKEKLTQFSKPVRISDVLSPWIALTVTQNDNSNSLYFFNLLTKAGFEKGDPKNSFSDAKFLNLKTVLFRSNKDGEFNELYQNGNFPDFKESQQITAGKAELENIEISLDRKQVALTWVKDHFHSGEVLTWNDSAKLPSKKEFFKPNQGLIQSLAIAHSELFFVSSHLFKMPQLSQWTERGTQTLLNAEKLFTPCKPLEFHSGTFSSFDKQLVPTWYFGPPEKENKKLILQLSHNWYSRQSPHFQEWLLYAAQQGFGFVVPNLRGSIGFGKTFAALGAKNKKNEVFLEAQKALEFAKTKKPWSSLATSGEFLGGLLALRVQQENAALKSLVFQPVYDLQSLLAQKTFLGLYSWNESFGALSPSEIKNLSPKENKTLFNKILWLSPSEERRPASEIVTQDWKDWKYLNEEQKVEVYKKMLLFLDRD